MVAAHLGRPDADDGPRLSALTVICWLRLLGCYTQPVRTSVYDSAGGLVAVLDGGTFYAGAGDDAPRQPLGHVTRQGLVHDLFLRHLGHVAPDGVVTRGVRAPQVRVGTVAGDRLVDASGSTLLRADGPDERLALAAAGLLLDAGAPPPDPEPPRAGHGYPPDDPRVAHRREHTRRRRRLLGGSRIIVGDIVRTTLDSAGGQVATVVAISPDPAYGSGSPGAPAYLVEYGDDRTRDWFGRDQLRRAGTAEPSSATSPKPPELMATTPVTPPPAPTEPTEHAAAADQHVPLPDRAPVPTRRIIGLARTTPATAAAAVRATGSSVVLVSGSAEAAVDQAATLPHRLARLAAPRGVILAGDLEDVRTWLPACTAAEVVVICAPTDALALLDVAARDTTPLVPARTTSVTAETVRAMAADGGMAVMTLDVDGNPRAARDPLVLAQTLLVERLLRPDTRDGPTVLVCSGSPALVHPVTAVVRGFDAVVVVGTPGQLTTFAALQSAARSPVPGTGAADVTLALLTDVQVAALGSWLASPRVRAAHGDDPGRQQVALAAGQWEHFAGWPSSLGRSATAHPVSRAQLVELAVGCEAAGRWLPLMVASCAWAAGRRGRGGPQFAQVLSDSMTLGGTADDAADAVRRHGAVAGLTVLATGMTPWSTELATTFLHFAASALPLAPGPPALILDEQVSRSLRSVHPARYAARPAPRAAAPAAWPGSDARADPTAYDTYLQWCAAASTELHSRLLSWPDRPDLLELALADGAVPAD